MKKVTFKTEDGSIGHIEVDDNMPDEDALKLVQNQEPQSTSGGKLYPAGIEVEDEGNENLEPKPKPESGGKLFPAGVEIDENK